MSDKSFVIDMTRSVGENNRENNSTYDFYKRTVLELMRELGLSIAGENPPRVRRGVDQAGYKNVLTVGTAPHHDVEWIDRKAFACEKGYSPVLDLVKDWKLINQKLFEYYKDKYEIRLQSGAVVTIHDGFVKIGTELVTFEELGRIMMKYNDLR